MQHDILDTMLEATDPQTGERLSDENIRYQMVTFLIAGHETTSGLLTFTLYELLRQSRACWPGRARTSTRCWDGGRRASSDLAKLTYLDQILKETLRLWPTAPAFAVQPLEDTVIGGKLPGHARASRCWCSSRSCTATRRSGARTPRRSTRTASRSSGPQALPPNAWKPFGNGQRSCIGRGFALQEATLFLAMMLQRFDLTPADPDYQLKSSRR